MQDDVSRLLGIEGMAVTVWPITAGGSNSRSRCSRELGVVGGAVVGRCRSRSVTWCASGICLWRGG